MALVQTNMGAVAAGPSRLWVYDSGADSVVTVGGANYFNDMAEVLLVGDTIMVSPAAGTAGILVVTDITDGTVTVA